MTEPGNVLDLAPLGVRVEILKTAAQTDGESLEIEVVGRARGLLGQSTCTPVRSSGWRSLRGRSSSASTVASTGWARARRWRSPRHAAPPARGR